MQIGASYEVSHIVGYSDLASSLSDDPQDKFPDVLATAKMVALMELAAARLMKPTLSEGELSVGVSVDVIHKAATPNRAEIKAVATYLGMEGKLHKFDVVLLDPAGEAGSGTHTRAIIDTERLLGGAANRGNKTSK